VLPPVVVTGSGALPAAWPYPPRSSSG